MMKYISVAVGILVLCIPHYCSDNEDESKLSRYELKVKRFSKYQCYKLEHCNKQVNVHKVCGRDVITKNARMFENLCMLYKYNCENKSYNLDANILN
ncbi:uncharacterized protein LOC128678312 isoform X2 [Plodia interpunctella]|uniref:uncharacterized protein LOC128678312 isoform X2 n=1 Tax=Plodia interpunctella TaxID=58824 RepID=UPI00236870EA|nr:uncharacterized protein LOC128678312 isoform X2 [Plodia interpunctella]